MRNTDKLNRYVQFMFAKNFSAATIRVYKSAIIRFLKTITDDTSRISRQTVQDYIFNIPKEMSNSYRDQAINTIRLYFRVIEQKEFSFIELPRPKKQQFIPNILTVDQVEAVIFNTKNIKHKAILYTIYDNGLRINECLNLQLIDVRSKTKKPQLIIRDAKHHSARIVYLSNRCIALIQEYYKIEKPQRYLFEGPTPCTPYSKTSVNNILQTALKREGIQLRIRIHDLRHAFATHCLEAGTDIYHLSKILGHKSVKTTESTYSHLCSDKLVIKRPHMDVNLSEVEGSNQLRIVS